MLYLARTYRVLLRRVELASIQDELVRHGLAPAGAIDIERQLREQFAELQPKWKTLPLLTQLDYMGRFMEVEHNRDARLALLREIIAKLEA